MARKTDLMGMGVNPIQARRMATDPQVVAAAGGTGPSATQIGGDQYLVSVTSGSGGVALPAVGGDSGALLGDDFIINNQLGATLAVYGPSGVTISISGANTNLTTGVSLATHVSLTAYPITASSWLGIKSA